MHCLYVCLELEILMTIYMHHQLEKVKDAGKCGNIESTEQSDFTIKSRRSMFSVARITHTFVGQTPNARQDTSIDKLCRGKLLFEGKN